MEDFKKFSLLKEGQTNTSDHTVINQELAESQMIQLLRWFEVEKQAGRIDDTWGYDEIVSRFTIAQRK